MYFVATWSMISHAAHHGGNAERLRAVKRSYDPERLFRFPQAI